MLRTNVVYKIHCGDCDKHYVGQTERKLSTRIHEHKLATKRHGQFSLVSVHEDQDEHKFNWSTVHILAQARTKNEREFIEAWYSTEKAINKHIEINPVYRPLQTKELRNSRKEDHNATQLGNGPIANGPEAPQNGHPTNQ
ncbi:hypothetical protein CLF_111426 [Clonorchis sinensis]|uniref:GIY-YIG domain-containing protein n=1 Tax=Clonorchis sinensis TaxID=79923 RepID=G7YUV2_CLOSI|nr:hypothetical protein CLF_111426 [Clonorchis sinensis]